MSVLALMLATSMASALQPDKQPSVLGELVHAGCVYEMNREELEAEMTKRKAAFSALESDDHLRLKLLAERARLLNYRNTHVTHAAKVLEELDRAGAGFLSDLSIDTIMADDNAVFTGSLGTVSYTHLTLPTIYSV